MYSFLRCSLCMLLSRCLLRMGIGIANRGTPAIAQNPPIIFPAVVNIAGDPYPIVVIVIRLHQTYSRIL